MVSVWLLIIIIVSITYFVFYRPICYVIVVVIPNHTILVHLNGISGEFGWAMICILVRCS